MMTTVGPNHAPAVSRAVITRIGRQALVHGVPSGVLVQFPARIEFQVIRALDVAGYLHRPYPHRNREGHLKFKAVHVYARREKR